MAASVTIGAVKVTLLGKGGVAFWDSGVSSQEVLDGSGTDTAPPRIVNALYAAHPWDTAYMAGKQLPGHCEVANGLTEIGIDMKKPDGADGSTITLKGYKPGKFEISCTVWTDDQWQILQDIIKVVWRRPQKNAKLASLAFDVSHPALQLLGVSSCVVQAVTYPQAGKFEGSKVVQFKCVENVPAGKKPVTKNVTPAGPVVTEPLQSKVGGAEPANFTPANATPAKPSTLKKHTGPKGPKPGGASGQW